MPVGGELLEVHPEVDDAGLLGQLPLRRVEQVLVAPARNRRAAARRPANGSMPRSMTRTSRPASRTVEHDQVDGDGEGVGLHAGSLIVTLTRSHSHSYRQSDDNSRREVRSWRTSRRYPFFHHLRADTTGLRRSTCRTVGCRHAGPGQAFWFRPRTAALAEVPLDDREQALLFHARTADFQDVTVQATVSYRVVDPALAATTDRLRHRPGDRSAERDAARDAGRAAHRAGPAAGARAARRHGAWPTRWPTASAPSATAVAAALADDVRLAERGTGGHRRPGGRHPHRPRARAGAADRHP